ncbi:MAG: hypothetical protein SOI26_08820 [Coriobacteriales bacterium]|jgi:polyphosphate kinase 2 (PPK2 family)
MLDEVVFEPQMDKGLYHERRDQLGERLMVLQQQAKAAKLGTVIIFEGWHAAGKGACISNLVVNLDPRLYSVHNIADPVGYEARLPFMARFWSRLGAHGTMTIFNRSYYDALSRSYVDEVREGNITADRATREALTERAMRRIKEHVGSARAFETQLEADGYLIVKLFLHITKQEQTRRTIDLLLDQNSSWKVDDRDMSQLRHYEDYYRVFDRWLSDPKFMTTGVWHVVPSQYKRNATIQVMQTIADEMTRALEARGFDTSQPIPAGDEPVVTVTPAQRAFAELEAAQAAEERAARELEDGAADADPTAANGGRPLTAAMATEQARQEAQAAAVEAAGEARQAVARAAQDGTRLADDTGEVHYTEKQARRVVGSVKGLTSRFRLVDVPDLDDVRHDLFLSKEEYHERLDEEQRRLRELSLQLYRHRIPMVIAYEGWDAAGKGGNIKRVASALDARNYQVYPIASPSADELAHPFLWRFWNDLPRTGHVSVFDRTWYGRVLVERIEGFAKPWEWHRAFEEINEFEDDLRVWGAVLVKFWVDVSAGEQLRRFQDRESDPARRWKITQEDWRNRSKNDLYRVCVNDMLHLTSTEYAPWVVIESDDKRYARVKALHEINRAIERRLKL